MNKTGGFLYWAPRIMAILFIGFLTLFSLDVFEPGISAGEAALGFLMHNIPSIILIVLLIIAWKKDLVGALTFLGAGLLYIGFVGFNAANSGLPWYIALTWSATIAGPAFIVGILFLLNWKMKRE